MVSSIDGVCDEVGMSKVYIYNMIINDDDDYDYDYCDDI